ncbi:hypothetical protein T4E_3644 [Trichinella pseudospiralis]|nr:hypothetical protein T4E_3644 [Trichinella pseudospiralis]
MTGNEAECKRAIRLSNEDNCLIEEEHICQIAGKQLVHWGSDRWEHVAKVNSTDLGHFEANREAHGCFVCSATKITVARRGTNAMRRQSLQTK